MAPVRPWEDEINGNASIDGSKITAELRLRRGAASGSTRRGKQERDEAAAHIGVEERLGAAGRG